MALLRAVTRGVPGYPATIAPERVAVQTPWGIDENGDPYYDTEGADTGEQSMIISDGGAFYLVQP